MKILHVITSLWTGGAEKLVSEIVPLLRNKGNDVDVCSFVGQETNFKKKLESANIKVISFTGGNNVYNPLYIIRLAKLMRNYDIIHTHNTSPQLYAAIASLFCKVKLVTTEHSTSNHRRDSGKFKLIDRWMYNKYKTVICISDKTKENLQVYLGKTKADVIVINNGIDVQKYGSAKPLSDEEKHTDKFVVTMVAGFRYQKDHETVIRAFKHLDAEKFELWFVGDGECRSEVEASIKDNDLTNVRLWGVRSDIPSILKSSDIVVQSSHIEGFGLAALEGMAAGKPVIATEIPGLAQVVNGAGILVQHKDDKALADEIQKFKEDTLYYTQIADKCFKRADYFDIHKMVKEYQDVYDKLMVND